LRRHEVEPLPIVDDTQQRRVLGRRRQEAQHREPYQKSVRDGPGALPERGLQRGALRSGQAVEAVEQRCTQLVQAGEGEFHFGLDADGAGHVESRCPVGDVVEQRGLADTRFAAQHQHLTLAGPRV
jgi:hypothetical protein